MAKIRFLLIFSVLIILCSGNIRAQFSLTLDNDTIGLEDIGDDTADGYVYDASKEQATAKGATFQETIKERIDGIVGKHKGYNVGIYVYDLTSDSVLYTLKEKTKFIPASNQKLLVSISALSELGAMYDFNTIVYVDGKIAKTEDRRPYLKGDLYVSGCFDPLLASTVYEKVGEKIASMNIDSIDGHIYADISLKEKLGSKTKASWESVPSALYTYLLNRGFKFTYSSPYGQASRPKSARKKLITVSTPITTVLQRMMKRSDNFYAECMYLNLADITDPENWSYKACAEQIRKVFRKAGANPDDGIVSDGSGLSHSNKVTPEMMGKLLIYAARHRRIYEPLYESLPIAGVDGTLGRRMSSGPAYKNVHAKTGTVRGVSTLSGYVTASNGHKLVFSILNNNISSASLGRTFQNEVCQELAR